MKITVLSDGHGKNGSSLFIQFSEKSGLDNNINEKTPFLIDLGPGYELGVTEYLERIGKTSNKKINVLITHTHADHFCPENLFYKAYASGIKEINLFGPAQGEYKNGNLESKLLTRNTSEYVLNAINSNPITGAIELEINCYDIFPSGNYEKSVIKQKQRDSLEMEKFFLEKNKFMVEMVEVNNLCFSMLSSKTYSVKGVYGEHVIPTISGYSIEELFLKFEIDNKAAKNLAIDESELGRKIKNLKDKVLEFYKKSELINIFSKSSELVKEANKDYEKEIIKMDLKNVKATYITDTGLYFGEKSIIERFQNLAMDSDILIVGANKLFQEQEGTGGRYHLSLKDALLLKDSSNSKRLSLMHFPWTMERFTDDIKNFYLGLKNMSKHQKEAFLKFNEILLERNDVYIAYSGIQYEITSDFFKVKSKKWMK
ncbi:MAG: hypothetical protein ACP5OZ_03420 [Candidatus Woesearchaeota archaeon]